MAEPRRPQVIHQPYIGPGHNGDLHHLATDRTSDLAFSLLGFSFLSRCLNKLERLFRHLVGFPLATKLGQFSLYIDRFFKVRPMLCRPMDNLVQARRSPCFDQTNI